jgi:hypothetical protein
MIAGIRSVGTVLGVVSALFTSQAPEFAQQYQQRLGGAIGELRPIVENFDADAQRSDLTREEALALYGKSHEQFLRDRGKSMVEVFERYERLVRQRDALNAAGDLARPVLVAYSADSLLGSDTAEDFQPGMPLTLTGLVYAAIGFGVSLLLALGLRGLLTLNRRRRWSTDL